MQIYTPYSRNDETYVHVSDNDDDDDDGVDDGAVEATPQVATTHFALTNGGDGDGGEKLRAAGARLAVTATLVEVQATANAKRHRFAVSVNRRAK
jgi:hypothetical protein